jgi:hypothetical protein
MFTGSNNRLNLPEIEQNGRVLYKRLFWLDTSSNNNLNCFMIIFAKIFVNNQPVAAVVTRGSQPFAVYLWANGVFFESTSKTTHSVI